MVDGWHVWVLKVHVHHTVNVNARNHRPTRPERNAGFRCSELDVCQQVHTVWLHLHALAKVWFCVQMQSSCACAYMDAMCMLCSPLRKPVTSITIVRMLRSSVDEVCAPHQRHGDGWSQHQHLMFPTAQPQVGIPALGSRHQRSVR